MSQVAVSQQTGYARNASESAYPDLWRGLLGWWCPSVHFRGGQKVFDLSNRQQHLTLINMSNSDWQISQGYGALSFDGGVNDAAQGTIDTNYFKPASNPFSFSGWIYVRVFRGTTNNFFSIANLGTTDWNALQFQVFQGKLTFTGDTNGLSGWDLGSGSFGTTTLVVGRWYHVAGTRSGAGVYTVYLDGKSDGTQTQASDLFINNTTIRLGGHYGGNTTFDADGFIDDFRIYNRALTASEIRLLASRRGIGLERSFKRKSREDVAGFANPVLFYNHYVNQGFF